MAEEKVELKDINYRQIMPWTELFRGFQVALDPKKLLLAAGGILVMAVGWYVLAAFFFWLQKEPTWGDGKEGTWGSWANFQKERKNWNLLNEAAGSKPTVYAPDDLAESAEEYNRIKEKFDSITEATKDEIAKGKRGPIEITIQGKNDEGEIVAKTVRVSAKPFGKMGTLPWSEDRGDNPYLLVTGQVGSRGVPWDKGQFWDWLLTKENPVLLEPLVKFLRPMIFLLNPNALFLNKLYFLLTLLWTLATWGFFGGAITRMAAVQLTRKEKISIGEAIQFTRSRYTSFFTAPLIPLIGVLLFLILLILFGVLHLIPLVGDIIDGVGWPLVLLAGLVMAVILVGLTGWPMMYATISTEGSDSFDALSRSYSYVLTNPWHYIWYALVALTYGAIVVFFIGFMGSLTVYLGKWGVSQTPFIGPDYVNREPEYLFQYAPKSFGWRELLLQGSSSIDIHGEYTQPDQWHVWNRIGAGMVAIWLGLLFLMVVGFGYSYFWTASTIIYLLMRRKVDDTEMDEVYVEEDESEEGYSMPITAPASSAPSSALGTTSLTMVEAPPSPPISSSGSGPPSPSSE
jgi:hypothetical protein